MLMPKKVKHRKHHRGRTKGIAKGATEVTYGDFGIQALEPGWITARQIEAGRIAMTPPRPAWVRAKATRSTGSPL